MNNQQIGKSQEIIELHPAIQGSAAIPAGGQTADWRPVGGRDPDPHPKVEDPITGDIDKALRHAAELLIQYHELVDDVEEQALCLQSGKEVHALIGKVVPIEIEAHLARMAGEYERMLNEERTTCQRLYVGYSELLGPELRKRRYEQDEQWGGPRHDDQHTLGDWIGYIDKFRQRAWAASQSDMSMMNYDYENNLLHIAALCIAAIQSSRRKKERMVECAGSRRPNGE